MTVFKHKEEALMYPRYYAIVKMGESSLHTENIAITQFQKISKEIVYVYKKEIIGNEY